MMERCAAAHKLQALQRSHATLRIATPGRSWSLCARLMHSHALRACSADHKPAQWRPTIEVRHVRASARPASQQPDRSRQLKTHGRRDHNGSEAESHNQATSSRSGGRGRGGSAGRGGRGGGPAAGRGGRGAGRGRGGRGGGRGRGGSAAQSVTFAAWAADVERLCAQRSPPGGHLYSAAARLSDVTRSDLSQGPSRERAVHLVAQLLQCVAARTDLQTTPILLAASASLSAHEGLLQAAKESPALSAAVCSVIDAALRAPDTWADPRHVSQLAVAQQRLNVFFEPFWQRLGANEVAQLGVRAGGQRAACVCNAHASWQRACMDAQLCMRLAGTVAAARKQRAVAQEVSNTFWALGVLEVVPDAQALASLHTMAARLAPSMTPQEVSNTLLGLAKLRQPVDAALQRELLAAVQRQAASGSMNCARCGKQPLGAVGAGLVSLGRASRASCGRLARSRAAVRHRHEPAGRVKHAAGARQAAATPSMTRCRPRCCLRSSGVQSGWGQTTQDVANTLWSLSELRWQRAATVSEALLAAVQRVAGSMSAEDVASSLLSMATLQWPLRCCGGRGAGSLCTRSGCRR